MKRIYLLMVCMCLLPGWTWAQMTVTGTVLDENGDGAIGANVVVEGTTVGTVTDFDGQFELKVPEGKKNLVISYLGYRTVTVPAKPTMKVKLETESHQIAEVVVTGMVAQDKRLFSGATTRLDAESTMLSGMSDVSRSLEGRAAGVTVQTVSATFGAAPKIRVRGATSIYGASQPLWVVDGVIIENTVEMDASDLSSGNADNLVSNAIAGLNADDIESIQILKDGSATSIYGARANAGVIVVTTKKGRSGHVKLNYTGEFTYRMKPSYADYNVCNSQEQMGIYQELETKGWLEPSNLNSTKHSGVYGKMWKLIDTYDPVTGKFGLENTQNARNAYLREAEYRNTDWFDLLFNNTIMMNHSVSMTAGTDRARTYASMSVMYDPGWYKKSGVQRYTGNMKAEFDLLPSTSSQKLTLTLNTSGTYIKQEAPGSDDQQTDAVTGTVSREFNINPFSFALNTSRTLDPKENYRRNYCNFNIFDELNNNYLDKRETNVKFQGELSYKPIKGLEIRGLASIRYQSDILERHIKDNSNQARAYRAGLGIDEDDVENDLIRDANEYLYTDPDVAGALPVSVLPEGGIYDLAIYKLLSVDLRGSVSYNHGFANDGSEGEDHLINIFAGVESNSTNKQGRNRSTGKSGLLFRGWGYQYENGGVPYYSYKVFKQGIEEGNWYFQNLPAYSRNLAFFATATYSYQSRYSVTGTVRYEGSNQLGRSRTARWLPTWNISGKWDAAAERFWRPTFGDAWTAAELRASYSLTGARGPYWVDNSLDVLISDVPWKPTAESTETSIHLSDVSNPDLTYEKKYEINVGTTLGFVKNRISLDVDWYMRHMPDQIVPTVTSGEAGSDIIMYMNSGTLFSTGVEVALSTVNFNMDKFRWTSSLTFSYQKNNIKEMVTNMTRIYNLAGGTGNGRRVGYPLNAVFSYKFAGLTEEGLPTFYWNEDNTEILGPDRYSEINMQSYDDNDIRNQLKFEGSQDPSFDGGFSNEFTLFKNLKITVFLTYGFGGVVRLTDLCYTRPNTYTDLTASPREMKNRWVMPGDEATSTIPVIASKRQYASIEGLAYAYQAYNLSDQRIARADFIRLKEVAVEYSFPKKWFDKQKAVSSFSAKVSGTNLALLYADKKLNGLDPEFFNVGGTASPVPRQFTLTLRLGF